MIALITGFPAVAGALGLGRWRTDAPAPRGHGPEPVDSPRTVLAGGHPLLGGHVLVRVSRPNVPNIPPR